MRSLHREAIILWDFRPSNSQRRFHYWSKEICVISHCFSLRNRQNIFNNRLEKHQKPSDPFITFNDYWEYNIRHSMRNVSVDVHLSDELKRDVHFFQNLCSLMNSIRSEVFYWENWRRFPTKINLMIHPQVDSFPGILICVTFHKILQTKSKVKLIWMSSVN